MKDRKRMKKLRKKMNQYRDPIRILYLGDDQRAHGFDDVNFKRQSMAEALRAAENKITLLMQRQ